MAQKITKIQIVDMMMADANINTNEVYMAYLERERELLTKKSANKKATAKQTENEAYKRLIVNFLGEVGRATIAELIDGIPDFASFTPQKVSALLTQLVKGGEIVKDYEKKTPYFSLAEVED